MAARQNLFERFNANESDGDYNDPDGPDSESELDRSMSDEEEFVPLSESGDSSISTDSSDAESIPDEAIHLERSTLDEDESRDRETVHVQSPRDRNVAIPSYRAKDGQIWFSEPPTQRCMTPSNNIFNVPRNKVPNTGNKNSPAEVFGLFLDEQMMNEIMNCTNDEGRRQNGDRWKETDIMEIDALVGVFLMIGAQKQSKVSTLVIWSPIIGQDYVRAAMSRERFFQLVSALRFDKKETRRVRQSTDKLAAFRRMFDMHNANLQMYYVPGAFLCVDEQLVPFRGRCSFIQYIPSKPGKYGLKLFWICDSENSYPLKGMVYIGKEVDQPIRQTGDLTLGASMVMRLAEPFTGKGRNITCDNFFTDNLVSNKLKQKKTTVVGTVRRDKRFLPQKFSGKKELNLYESAFGFQEDRMICSYQGHRPKNVILISSMHDDAAIDTSSEKQKPEVVLFYNKTKGGVDSMDKMALSYTTKRATKRWPMVLFCNLLDLSTIAARVVFEQKNPGVRLAGKDARGDFIREISKTLLRDQIIRRNQTLVKASRPLKNVFETCLKSMGVEVATPASLNSNQETGAKGGRKRGRCNVCPWQLDRKGTSKCQKCHNFLCKSHSVVICGSCLK